MRYSFKNDYSEGGHPRIIELLASLTDEQQEGYGNDHYSTKAKNLIKEKIDDFEAEVHFVSGGTQANLIVIAAALRPYESVIAAETGHIHVHETGSIEATGHKINTVATDNGKLSVQAIQKVLEDHNDVPHMVVPKLVYISNGTELGTIYKKTELQELYEFCISKELFLFLDGARLGSALASSENDLTLQDLAKHTDVFYIGGTKNGALLGEAIVITHPQLKEILPFHIKQRGGMLAKGSVLGIQFLGLFENNYFIELAKHANAMSKILIDALQKNEFPFLIAPVTNQLFPILPNHMIEDLLKEYDFHLWKKINASHTAIRLVTSWKTPENKTRELANKISKYTP